MKWYYFILYLLVFFFALGTPVDLDLGWHLRYGEYFYKTGHVLRENIISSVWPDYTWVQASWGYDLILYPLFRAFEFVGISLAAAFSTLGIFLLLTWKKRASGMASLIILAILFLANTQPLFVAGFRAQTLSAVFFAATLVATREKRFTLLPILFLLWANIHGGFILGLTVLWIMWCAKPNKQEAAYLLLSTATPLVNPWGMKLYAESLLHATNTSLTTIGEWTPIWGSVLETGVTITSAVFGILILIISKKRHALTEVTALVLLAVLALSAIRFIIPFGIFLTYILASIAWPIKRQWATAVSYLFVALFFFDLIGPKRYFVLPPKNLLSFTWDTYCQTLGTCSETIAQALQNEPEGNGFHTYNWGGYLVWRAPKHKTLIDGRMITWEKDGKTPPIEDAERVISEKDPITWRRLDSQYRFAWAIVPDESPISQYLHQDTKWEKVTTDGMYSLFLKP